MSKAKKSAAEPADKDAVEMLIADHMRVKRLFAQFDALKGDGSDSKKAAVIAQVCRELTIHTSLEEEIFYPAVRDAIDDADLMDEALVEHAGAKQLIAQLEAAQPEDPLYDAKVTVLSEQIEHHVTEEEGSMFPQARHSGVDTVELATRMIARKSELLRQEDNGERGDAAPKPGPPSAKKKTAKAASSKRR